MDFSQEIIESSQQSNRNSSKRRGRSRHSGIPVEEDTVLRRSKRTRGQPQQHYAALDSGNWQSETILTIPETGTEPETPLNLSASLFDGQQELLQKYQDHEQINGFDENTMDKEVEKSRQAYERLRMMDSSNMFSKDVPQGMNGVPREIIRSRVDVGVQCDEQQRCNGFRTSGQKVSNTRDLREVAVQIAPETRAVAINTDNNPIGLSTKNIAVQTIPEASEKPECHSVATNTDPVPEKHTKTRNVAVQMYHTTRVRDVHVQTDGTDESAVQTPASRHVSRRNVSIQYCSGYMLELTKANMVGLGARLGLDPHQLRRAIIKTISEQRGELVPYSGRQELFNGVALRDEPYASHLEYFLGETREETEADSTHSEVDGYLGGGFRFEQGSERASF